MNTGTKAVTESTLELAGRSTLLQAFWITVFTLSTALGAQLEIPHVPVPFTLQTLFVLLAGAFLGARNGAISQLLYLASGALGAPVFSGGAFGMAKILGPTGGYLLSFPIAAAITGYLVSYHRGLLWSFVSMTAGLFVVFFLGTVHLYAFALHNWSQAIQSGFLIFSWWDLVKLTAAATTYHEVAKRWPRLPA